MTTTATENANPFLTSTITKRMPLVFHLHHSLSSHPVIVLLRAFILAIIKKQRSYGDEEIIDERSFVGFRWRR